MTQPNKEKLKDLKIESSIVADSAEPKSIE